MISVIKKFKKDPLIYIAIAVVVIYTYMKFFRTEGMNTNKLSSLGEFNTSMTPEELEDKGEQRRKELSEARAQFEADLRGKQAELDVAKGEAESAESKYNNARGWWRRSQLKGPKNRSKAKKQRLERELQELKMEAYEFVKMEQAVKDHIISVAMEIRERGETSPLKTGIKGGTTVDPEILSSVKTGIKGGTTVDPKILSSVESLDSLPVKPSSFGFTMEGKNATCTWDGGAAIPAGPLKKVSDLAYAMDNINDIN